MEKLNNREREYLDTISELKTKLMASEKLINKQETIIISLNQQLNNLPNKVGFIHKVISDVLYGKFLIVTNLRERSLQME